MIKYRRVYYDSVKKYALKIGATAIPVVFVIFMLLSQRGDITITGYSGNMTCAGTEEDPCYAYINFTANTDIYIYPNQNWTFSTNPPVKEVILQRSWGDSWRTIYLNKTWSSRIKYAVKFSKGKNYQIRFIGYKFNPRQDVKWSFGNIDPYWYGKETLHIIPSGEKFIGINPVNAIYVSKSHLGKYINFNIQQINETYWGVNYTINQSLVDDLKNCYKICENNWNSLKCLNSATYIRNNYFSELSSSTLKTYLQKIKKYPIKKLTSNLDLYKNETNYLDGGDYFLVYFPNGFKPFEKFKMGFDTVTFTSGSQSPANLTQRDDNHPYLNASITPYSDVSTTINCTLYVDNIANQTVNDIANNTAVYLNSTTLALGDHTWYINCTDDNWATQTQSEVRTIGVGSSFSRCAVLIDDYGIYNLTGDIINSGITKCINIEANNVIFDCKGHTVDGDDAAKYGIYVYRVTATTANVTIKNCTVSDYSSVGIYFSNAENSKVSNVNIINCPSIGLRADYSDYSEFTNINASYDAEVYSSPGIYLYYTDYSNVSNATVIDNHIGIEILNSNNIRVVNATSNNNYDVGLYLSGDSIYIENVTAKNNGNWDIQTKALGGNSEFVDVIGSGDRPIVMYRTSVTLSNWNNNVSEIILANADGSVLSNILIDSHNGLFLDGTDSSNFTNITLLNGRGMYLNGNNNIIDNLTSISNKYGIYVVADTSIIKNSKFEDSTDYGIYFYAAGYNGANTVYNNLLNNTNNFYISNYKLSFNNWNTTKQIGTRIYQGGAYDAPYIGGNYWTNSTGNGYSDICTDSDNDGFCDDVYTLATDNIDYLPYSDEYIPDTTGPLWSDNSTNTTYAGTYTEFRTFWWDIDDYDDPANLSYYIFSWYNGTNWTKTTNSGDKESGEQSFSGVGGGNVTQVSSATAVQQSSSSSSWTHSHTLPSGGTNRLLIIAIYGTVVSTNNVVSSVTYNGVSATHIIDSDCSACSSDPCISLWYMNDTSLPSDGGSYDLDVSLTASITGTSMLVLLQNANQSTPTNYLQNNMIDNNVALVNDSLPNNVSTNSIVLDFLNDEGAPPSAYAVTGQTEIYNSNTGVACGTEGSCFASNRSTGDNWMSWNNTSASGNWEKVHVLLEISSVTGISTEEDANKTPVTYQNVITNDLYEQIDNITVTVNVSYYNTSGSIENDNTNATLWLEAYNGTDWVDEGDFGVGGSQSTGNYSITITTPSVLTGWKTEGNRDIRISARFMDYNDTDVYDEINWTDVWVETFSEQEFLNDTAVIFSDPATNESWANVTKLITNIGGATIKWKVYANDSIGNWNVTDEFSFETTTSGAPDIEYSINSNTGATKIMFLNCSPDWEYYPSEPQYQTSTEGIINATNNGTATGDFQIEYIGTLADGWELWSCNASSTDPKTSSNCILLSTSWQTIWNGVAANEEKNVWLYANCSYVSSNPNVNIDMQAVS